MERMIEVCCGSYEDALASYKGGAKRIELNSALYKSYHNGKTTWSRILLYRSRI